MWCAGDYASKGKPTLLSAYASQHCTAAGAMQDTSGQTCTSCSFVLCEPLSDR